VARAELTPDNPDVRPLLSAEAHPSAVITIGVVPKDAATAQRSRECLVVCGLFESGVYDLAQLVPDPHLARLLDHGACALLSVQVS
jgi:hypothetical protein